MPYWGRGELVKVEWNSREGLKVPEGRQRWQCSFPPTESRNGGNKLIRKVFYNANPEEFPF
jgi:hypothetical protein